MEQLDWLHKLSYMRLEASLNKAASNGCWETNLCKGSHGYGQITVGGTAWLTHRYSWWVHNGCPSMEIFKGKHVMHSCDNKSCCNPEHLRVGTPTENAIEAVERVRVIKPKKEKREGNYVATAGSFKPGHGSGESNVTAKLTWDDVREIRRRKAEGLKYGELKKMAQEYDIAYITIQKIVGNTLWKE